MSRSHIEETKYKRYDKRDMCVSYQTDTFKMKGKERRRGSKKNRRRRRRRHTE
jgi:hypothetical protein